MVQPVFPRDIIKIMRIHAYNRAPVRPTDLVFRQSRRWMSIGVGICLFLTAMGVVLIVGGAGWFGWVFTGMGILTTLPLLRRTLRSFSPMCWLLRYNPRLLLIRIGPTFSNDAAAVSVVELARDEVEWIRAYWQTTITSEAGETTSRACGYLEIKPRLVDLECLRSRIAAAGAPKTWRGWTIHTEIPVSLTAEGLIRLQWYGRTSFVTPSLKKAIRLLGKEFPVQPEVSEHNDFTVSTADKQKMEQQILELVEQGQLIDATKLARKRYGFSLAEARQFVEQLRGEKIPLSKVRQS